MYVTLGTYRRLYVAHTTFFSKMYICMRHRQKNMDVCTTLFVTGGLQRARWRANATFQGCAAGQEHLILELLKGGAVLFFLLFYKVWKIFNIQSDCTCDGDHRIHRTVHTVLEECGSSLLFWKNVEAHYTVLEECGSSLLFSLLICTSLRVSHMYIYSQSGNDCKAAKIMSVHILAKEWKQWK